MTAGDDGGRAITQGFVCPVISQSFGARVEGIDDAGFR